MTMLLGLCAVVITLAVTAIAITTLRASRRFENAAKELTRAAAVARASAAEVAKATRELRTFGRSLDTMAPSLRRAAHRVEDLGERALRLSNIVLNDVRDPIRATLAMIAVPRKGSGSLFGPPARRMARQEVES
jgi:hypothetical protein